MSEHTKEEHRCCGRVSTGDWGRSKQCTRNGTLEHEGKHYCKTHHPPSVKERDAQRLAGWRAELDRKAEEAKRKAAEKRELERKAAAYDDLLAALKVARDHIEMDALEISHCNDAELIRAAIAKAEAGKVGDEG